MPKIKPAAIDDEQIAMLASFGCTNIEIAEMARISLRTLNRRYIDVITNGRNKLAMSLRRKQYEMAMNGNVTMLIWLGKQYLGQTDKLNTEMTNNTTTNIVVDLGEDLPHAPNNAGSVITLDVPARQRQTVELDDDE